LSERSEMGRANKSGGGPRTGSALEGGLAKDVTNGKNVEEKQSPQKEK